jgi:hypothetical protein
LLVDSEVETEARHMLSVVFVALQVVGLRRLYRIYYDCY